MAVVFYNRNDTSQPLAGLDSMQLLYVCKASREQGGMPSAFHEHGHLELQYITEGEAVIRIDDRIYEVQPGDVVVYNSGSRHDETAEGGMCFYNCGIKGVALPGRAEGALLPLEISPVLHTGDQQALVAKLFESLHHQAVEGRSRGGQICHYLMGALLTLLLYEVPHEEEAASARLDEFFRQSKRYMEEHFTEELSIETLAAMARMSPSGFAHQFKKKVGISPLQYLIRCRIGRAQDLLISTRNSITDISIEVGYDNLSHFNNQFKRFVGISPQTYRKERVGSPLREGK